VLHVFDVADNRPQSSEQVEKRLEEQAQRLEQIAFDYSVEDNKDAPGKFRCQIEDVSSTPMLSSPTPYPELLIS